MDQPGEIYWRNIWTNFASDLREVSKTLAVWLQLTIELLPKETGEK